jgi:hypothetical protein
MCPLPVETSLTLAPISRLTVTPDCFPVDAVVPYPPRTFLQSLVERLQNKPPLSWNDSWYADTLAQAVPAAASQATRLAELTESFQQLQQRLASLDAQRRQSCDTPEGEANWHKQVLETRLALRKVDAQQLTLSLACRRARFESDASRGDSSQVLKDTRLLIQQEIIATQRLLDTVNDRIEQFLLQDEHRMGNRETIQFYRKVTLLERTVRDLLYGHLDSLKGGLASTTLRLNQARLQNASMVGKVLDLIPEI